MYNNLRFIMGAASCLLDSENEKRLATMDDRFGAPLDHYVGTRHSPVKRVIGFLLLAGYGLAMLEKIQSGADSNTAAVSEEDILKALEQVGVKSGLGDVSREEARRATTPLKPGGMSSAAVASAAAEIVLEEEPPKAVEPPKPAFSEEIEIKPSTEPVELVITPREPQYEYDSGGDDDDDDSGLEDDDADEELDDFFDDDADEGSFQGFE